MFPMRLISICNFLSDASNYVKNTFNSCMAAKPSDRLTKVLSHIPVINVIFGTCKTRFYANKVNEYLSNGKIQDGNNLITEYEQFTVQKYYAFPSNSAMSILCSATKAYYKDDMTVENCVLLTTISSVCLYCAGAIFMHMFIDVGVSIMLKGRVRLLTSRHS